MIKRLSFRIDNKYNNCPEFVGYMFANIPLTEELHYIPILLNNLTVNDKRAKNYYKRYKRYITLMPICEDDASPEILLENILLKVNKHAAKVTQEMHELNFTSISPVLASSNRQGYRIESSFEKLLKYGEDLNLPYDKYATPATYEEAQQAIDSIVTFNRKRPCITIDEYFASNTN